MHLDLLVAILKVQRIHYSPAHHLNKSREKEWQLKQKKNKKQKAVKIKNLVQTEHGLPWHQRMQQKAKHDEYHLHQCV